MKGFSLFVMLKIISFQKNDTGVPFVGDVSLTVVWPAVSYCPGNKNLEF